MRKILFLFLLALIINVKGQSGSDIIKISKEQLIKCELITELIKDVPVDCKVTSYLFSIKTNDKTFKIDCVGNELRLEIQDAFKKANKGDKFSFNKLETACLEKHKKKYSFVITD